MVLEILAVPALLDLVRKAFYVRACCLRKARLVIPFCRESGLPLSTEVYDVYASCSIVRSMCVPSRFYLALIVFGTCALSGLVWASTSGSAQTLLGTQATILWV